ncbi:hypothetical protein ACN27J_30520 [Solwaraspora sp. WMMB762]|uniref:hypothetical protein n=1 Tax=Solwaraspora sp. WMMB762 TaxID=3404120 RepID=UPI003B95F881
MRYLSTALISEGLSDDRFLPRLLARSLEGLCLTEFDETVYVADVQPVRDRTGPAGIDDVVSMVDRSDGAFAGAGVPAVVGRHPAGSRGTRLPARSMSGTQVDTRLVRSVPRRELEL